MLWECLSVVQPDVSGGLCLAVSNVLSVNMLTKTQLKAEGEPSAALRATAHYGLSSTPVHSYRPSF